MKQLLLFALLLAVISLHGQESLLIRPTFQGNSLVLGTPYELANGDTLEIHKLRFYLSDVQVFRGEELLSRGVKKHILLDASKPESLAIILDRPIKGGADRIQFLLGVDSLTSVAGATGGDLDPSQGMYWTWQSGYIHFKLEGTASSSKARKGRFMYHLGGYEGPYAAQRTISLSFLSSQSAQINLSIDKWLAGIDIGQTAQVMSPGKLSSQLADQLASCLDASKKSP
ncbi:MAG: MbnP family protein [Bacteroidota bacterium]